MSRPERARAVHSPCTPPPPSAAGGLASGMLRALWSRAANHRKPRSVDITPKRSTNVQHHCPPALLAAAASAAGLASMSQALRVLWPSSACLSQAAVCAGWRQNVSTTAADGVSVVEAAGRRWGRGWAQGVRGLTASQIGAPTQPRDVCKPGGGGRRGFSNLPPEAERAQLAGRTVSRAPCSPVHRHQDASPSSLGAQPSLPGAPTQSNTPTLRLLLLAPLPWHQQVSRPPRACRACLAWRLGSAGCRPPRPPTGACPGAWCAGQP